MHRLLVSFFGVVVSAGLIAACAHNDVIPGTNIADTPENREVVETIEKYRKRLVERNVEGLLALADQGGYFEDGGTPSASDDYGYSGLQSILRDRLMRLQSIRYEIQYRNVRITGRRAEVDVFIDGSFEVTSPEVGERYRRVNDHHRFVLISDKNGKWHFTSGM